MKVKFFYNELKVENSLIAVESKAEMVKWLAENPDIEIVSVAQSQTFREKTSMTPAYVLVTTIIIYKP